MTRVLILDDHEVVRRGLKEILVDADPSVEVGEAESAQTAIELLMSAEWNLALLDINLPGRNGLEALAEVKRLRPLMPVLVLSAYPEEEFAIRSLKLGASGYLSKSLSADEVVAAVKKALAGGKYVTASLAEKLAGALGRDVRHEPHEGLSRRELEVLLLVASGKSIKEIADELTLSEKTVGTYRTRISKKMGLGTNVELTRYALQHRLTE
jgi:two-component system invasion response regulator UvrY